MSELPDYSAFDAAPDTDSMSDLAGLARDLQDAEHAKAEAEDEVREHGRRIRDLKENRIPELMAELGLSEIKLEDGSKLTVGTKVRASIPKARAGLAMQWLADNGYADIVKHQVVVDAGKGDASELITSIESAGYMARDEQAVHPATLAKFVRDRLDEGEDVPLELFGAHVFNEAKLSKPKKKPSDF